MKKANPGAVFILTLVVAMLGVGSSPKETSVSQQTSITPPPSYIPPVCKGKPITLVPRDVALAQTPTEIKTNPLIAQSDQLQLFDTLAKTRHLHIWNGSCSRSRGEIAGA